MEGVWKEKDEFKIKIFHENLEDGPKAGIIKFRRGSDNKSDLEDIEKNKFKFLKQ